MFVLFSHLQFVSHKQQKRHKVFMTHTSLFNNRELFQSMFKARAINSDADSKLSIKNSLSLSSTLSHRNFNKLSLYRHYIQLLHPSRHSLQSWWQITEINYKVFTLIAPARQARVGWLTLACILPFISHVIASKERLRKAKVNIA